MVIATRVPVRSGLPNRAIKAHPATERPPYKHKGYWHSVPYKTVFQQTSGDYGAWMCNPNTNISWAIVPLKTDNGVCTVRSRSSSTR